MKVFLFLLLSFIFHICHASQGLLEPTSNSVSTVDEFKSALGKMKSLLEQAPEIHASEKQQAFISIGQLEKDVQRLSEFIRNKRAVLIQSDSKLKEDRSESGTDEDEDEEGDDNTTEEEAEQMLKDLTNKIWKTTEEILRAHTGISGLVGAIPPKIIT